MPDPTPATPSLSFGTDQVLLYNVAPWDKLGFGVPNFGRVQLSQNKTLLGLSDEIAKCQLFIMTHVDAMRNRPPSRNTVERLGRMCNRVNTVLSGREIAYNQNRLEPGHGQPQYEPWMIHPVPYFKGPIVQNRWLKEYNDYCMMALCNIYQHTENDLALTITPEAGRDIASYYGQIHRMLALELLLIPQAEYTAMMPFTEQHYAAYNPTQVTLRYEAIDRPIDPTVQFTEDDIRPFFVGIPSNVIIPNLAKYPHNPATVGWTGSKSDPQQSSAPATEGAEKAITQVL